MKLYILVGLPGSGKSTWTKKQVNKEPKTVVVNKDAIRIMLNSGKYVFDQEKEDLVKNIASKIAEFSLDKVKCNVIIDECNITRAKREKYVRIGREFGAEIIFVHFPENESNLQYRMKDPKGISLEKWNEVIEKMKLSFEYINDYEEDFDELITYGEDDC
jgi:predicted kinase